MLLVQRESPEIRMGLLRCAVVLAAFATTSRAAEPKADGPLCGRNGLGLALTFLDGTFHSEALDELLPSNRAPYSMADLERASHALGKRTFAAHWTRIGEATLDGPVILHVRSNPSTLQPNHYLVCFGETAMGLCVVDYPRQPFLLQRHQLTDTWDGDALYIDNGDGATINRLRREMFIRWAILAACAAAAVVVIGRRALGIYHARRSRVAA